MSLSTIKSIAANEFRTAFRSRAVYISAAILGVALMAALVVSWQNSRALNIERARYQELVRTNWLAQPDRHPHRSAHYGYLAFRPKSSLSFFDSGVDSFAGTSVFLEAHRQNTANFSEARHSNGLLRFGELNLALVLQLLVPLLIFFLGFATIAGERESGTLALVLAQGASSRDIIAGKTLGLLGIVGALSTPLVLLALALWLALSDFRVSADLVARIVLLVAGYGIYAVSCATLAVVVSSFAKTARGALMTLIVIWVFFWIALPRGVQTAGATIFPTPSKLEFDQRLAAELAREGDSHNPDDPKFAEMKRALLAEYGVTDVKQLPFNYNGYVMQKSEEISSTIFSRHFGELIADFQRQNRITELAGLVDPFIAVRSFSMAVAGSDFVAYEYFARQSEDFRYAMVQRLNDLHANEIKAANDRDQKVSHDIWDDFPAFEYREPTLGETVLGQIIPILSLLVWLGFAAAAIGTVKIRVR